MPYKVIMPPVIKLGDDARTPTVSGEGVRSPERLAAVMIFVYGDDSSDEQRQRVCAVAVVLGTEEQWGWLEPQWVARNNGIPFHARDCETDNGDYKHFSHAANKELYKDLTVMLAGSGLIGRVIAIDLTAKRAVFPDAPDIDYYKAFSDLMEDVREVSVHFNLPAKFTFDISSENEYNAGLLYQSIRENSPEMLEMFVSEISFVPAKYSARLQAADLLAYEGMKALDNDRGPVKRKRKSWQTLRQTERFHTGAFSWEWFEDLKRNMPRLEEMTGLTRDKYLAWLKERNRQHSISNLIHYTNWKAEQDRKNSRRLEDAQEDT